MRSTLCVRVTVSRANLSCPPHATCDGLECMCSAFGIDVNTFLIFRFLIRLHHTFRSTFSVCCLEGKRVAAGDEARREAAEELERIQEELAAQKEAEEARRKKRKEWADCDDEGQETERKWEEKAQENQGKSEAGREEKTREKPVGLGKGGEDQRQQDVRSEPEVELEVRTQEMGEKEVDAQEWSEEEGKREALGEREKEEEIVDRTCDDKDVSDRHITRWKNAWWIRVNSGPHMRSARGRRRTWRAAKQEAEQGSLRKLGRRDPRERRETDGKWDLAVTQNLPQVAKGNSDDRRACAFGHRPRRL